MTQVSNGLRHEYEQLSLFDNDNDQPTYEHAVDGTQGSVKDAHE